MSDERQDARSVRDRAERAERDAEHAERREDAMREDNIKAWATVRELRARVAELEQAIKVQASAVRSLDASRAARDAFETRTLRSLAGQERADLLRQLDAVREEATTWNARATELEAIIAERDAARAEVRRLSALLRRCVCCGKPECAAPATLPVCSICAADVERLRCAEACDAVAGESDRGSIGLDRDEPYFNGRRFGAHRCAAEIRALKKVTP